METFKCLEELEDLEYLYVNQYGQGIGSKSDVVDLRNTSIKTGRIRRCNCKYLFTKYYNRI